MKPLVIDLYCGLGGWSRAFLDAGYDAVGFDIERHQYGEKKYPGQLVLQDVLTLHGSQFKDAACIVASSPCQEFSYRAMPWGRAKSLAPPVLGIELFQASFRIQREASEAAGRHIPLIAENVKGAQAWVGRAAWHVGSFYLWGDLPAVWPHGLAPVKQHGSGSVWFDIGIAKLSSKSPQRRQRSAEIAEIPYDLAFWIAECFKPTALQPGLKSQAGR